MTNDMRLGSKVLAELATGNITSELSTLVDTVTLADGSPFEIEVTRYSINTRHGEAVLFSALIEEILRLKARVDMLEKEDKNE